MNIGFTGTRHGMTLAQRAYFKELLYKLLLAGYHVFHHGDCVGADDEAADIAAKMGFTIHCHPPLDETHRAFNDEAEYTHEPKDYFSRNRDIVHACDVLIGTPGTDTGALGRSVFGVV